MKRSLSGLLMILSVVACTDGTGVRADDLDIAATADGLRLTNNSGADLFYQAVDVETLALWAGPTEVTMCVEPRCAHVAPDETVVVRWPDVLGWRETTARVVVHWWRAVPDGAGGWRVSGADVQSREVDVP